MQQLRANTGTIQRVALVAARCADDCSTAASAAAAALTALEWQFEGADAYRSRVRGLVVELCRHRDALSQHRMALNHVASNLESVERTIQQRALSLGLGVTGLATARAAAIAAQDVVGGILREVQEALVVGASYGMGPAPDPLAGAPDEAVAAAISARVGGRVNELLNARSEEGFDSRVGATAMFLAGLNPLTDFAVTMAGSGDKLSRGDLVGAAADWVMYGTGVLAGPVVGAVVQSGLYVADMTIGETSRSGQIQPWEPAHEAYMALLDTWDESPRCQEYLQAQGITRESIVDELSRIRELVATETLQQCDTLRSSGVMTQEQFDDISEPLHDGDPN